MCLWGLKQMRLSGAEQFAAFSVGDKGWVVLPRVTHQGPCVQENKALEHNSPLNCVYNVAQGLFRAHSGAALLRCSQCTRMGLDSSCFDLRMPWQCINASITSDHSGQFSSAQPETQLLLQSAVGKRHISVFGLALRRQILLGKSIGSKSLRGTFLCENL